MIDTSYVGILIYYITIVSSQSCREYSESCLDDKACCGGCCMDGICRDTYQDCRLLDDPCMDVYCPADYDCYIYQPQDCGGCGPSRECRYSPSALDSDVKIHNLTDKNQSVGIVPEWKILYILLVLLISLYSKITCDK